MSGGSWPTVHLSRAEYSFKRRFIFERSILVVGDNIKHSGIKDLSDPTGKEWELLVAILDSPWTNDNDARLYFKFYPMKDNTETRAQGQFTIEEIHDSRPNVVHKEVYTLKLMRNEGFARIIPDGISIRPSLRRLTFSAHVSYVGNDVIMEKMNNPKKQLSETFTVDMGRKLQGMFESGKHSDVVFVVGDTEIPAHRQILAAFSDTFSAMFDHDSKEQLTGRVNISDCRADAFREMLRCLYTGEDPKWKDNEFTLALLFASDKYGIDTIKGKCVDRMTSTLTIHNITTMLQTVTMLDMEAAKHICFLFFKDSMKNILLTKSWKEFEKGNPSLASSLLKQACMS